VATRHREASIGVGARATSNELRAKLLADGAAAMSDGELLAIMLGGHSALERSQGWLERTGGLPRLLGSDARTLQELPALGPAASARLLAAVELGRRYLETPVRRRPLRNPQDAAVYFRARLADLPHEVFGCIFLDTRHRIITFEPLFRGTVDGAAVYPREILKRALYHNATAVIVGHNHPSGDCEPSEADRSITIRIKRSLALVDICLLDHLIVSPGACESLAERGLL
jgi:DNA repair protein RadC